MNPLTSPDWMADAPCAQIGPGLWDSPDTNRGPGDHWEAGRSVCKTCPFRTRCLETAMTLEGDNTYEKRGGMWGGLTPIQRAQLATQRKAKAS